MPILGVKLKKTFKSHKLKLKIFKNEYELNNNQKWKGEEIKNNKK